MDYPKKLLRRLHLFYHLHWQLSPPDLPKFQNCVLPDKLGFLGAAGEVRLLICRELCLKYEMKIRKTPRNSRVKLPCVTRNPSDPRHLELHHVKAHVKGGENTETNLTTLCNICHDDRHRKNV